MKRFTINILFVPLFAFVFVGSVVASEVDIHGFLSQGYMHSTDNKFLAANTEEGTFQFNEMGINFSSRVTSNLKIGAQFFARDLGEVGNDEVVLDWAFGDYSWREWLGLRVGRLKGNIGLYNETRDVDSLRTSILLPQSIYPELSRDLGQGLKGISAYGNVEAGPAGMMTYELLCADVYVSLDSGTAALIKASPLFSDISSIDFGRVYLGKFRWYAPLDGLSFAASGFDTKGEYGVTYAANGAPMIYKSDLQYLYFSAEYIWNNLTLATECNLAETVRTMYPVAAPSMKILDDDKKEATSWYAKASYRFTDWMEIGTYYSESVDDDDASGPANELNDIALSFRFDVNDYWIIKLEGHQMDGLLWTSAADDGTSDDDWSLFLAKVSYTF